MSELEYDHNWSAELLNAGITPASDPINLRGVIKQIIANLSAATGNFVPINTTTPGAPTTGTWVTGDSICDSNGILWNCTAGGTPGTWVQASIPLSDAVAGAIVAPFSGTGVAPSNSLGFNGDYAEDVNAGYLWGPKALGSYPGAPVSAQTMGFVAVTAEATTPIAIAAGILYVANTSSSVFNLPVGPTPGQVFGVKRGTSTAAITINAGTGQTIDGGASAGSIVAGATNALAQQSWVWLVATSSTTFEVLAVKGDDWGQGWNFTGTVRSVGVLSCAGQLTVSKNIVYGSPRSISATSSTVVGDAWVRCTSGTFTLTLANSVTVTGQEIRVTNEGTGVVTLTPATGTIDGVASRVLTGTSHPASAIVIFDGTNWHTLGSFGAVT